MELELLQCHLVVRAVFGEMKDANHWHHIKKTLKMPGEFYVHILVGVSSWLSFLGAIGEIGKTNEVWAIRFQHHWYFFL